MVSDNILGGGGAEISYHFTKKTNFSLGFDFGGHLFITIQNGQDVRVTSENIPSYYGRLSQRIFGNDTSFINLEGTFGYLGAADYVGNQSNASAQWSFDLLWSLNLIKNLQLETRTKYQYSAITGNNFDQNQQDLFFTIGVSYDFGEKESDENSLKNQKGL